MIFAALAFRPALKGLLRTAVTDTVIVGETVIVTAAAVGMAGSLLRK